MADKKTPEKEKTEVVYHYTSEEKAAMIRESGEIKPS